MKLALIWSDKKLSAKLTEFFAGTRDYHIAFVSDDGVVMWDQHWLFRREDWQAYSRNKHFDLFPCPFEISPAQLDAEVFQDVIDFCGKKPWLEVLYGWRDYIAFALRPVFHAFGRSTPNFGGRVCSGRIRDIGATHSGWLGLGTEQDPEPSPSDWRRWIEAHADVSRTDTTAAAGHPRASDPLSP